LQSQDLAWLRDGFDREALKAGLRGIEKETLRVDQRGQLSSRRHPVGFGSALSHPYITTDYSEALLELVTPPFPANWQLLQFLCDTHAFIHGKLDDEYLWPMSMPCVVNANESIPIADYGTSNLGLLKTVYRRGLGYRYGRAMQAIAGVHFNYSPPQSFWPAYRSHRRSDMPLDRFRSEVFMGLVRNYRRHAWAVTYLFGASPAFCKSFRPDGHELVEELNSSTWYAPFATSLRMSGLGYRNTSQARLSISANSFEEYLNALTAAVTTVEPAYEPIGIVVDGAYRQLNANLLQIENEYYGSIRPKPAKNGRRTTAGLRDGGVEYVEIRSLDLNPADPVGVNQMQLRVMETLALYCLLKSSPPIDAHEQEEIDTRDLVVAQEGRRPKLEISFAATRARIAEHGARLCDELIEIAALLDTNGDAYTESIQTCRAAFADSSLTPSARIIEDLRSRGQGFFEYSFEIAKQHHDYFLALGLPPARRADFERLAQESLAETRALEAATSESFEEYLRRYAADI